MSITKRGLIMKKATCRDLKGACDEVLTGETTDEMAQNSKAHVEKMMNAGDQAHLDAATAMMALTPEQQQTWYQEEFVAKFPDFADA